MIVIRQNIFIFVLPRKIESIKVKPEKIRIVVNKKNGKNENKRLTRLLNMDINAKQMSGITKTHLSTAYRYWEKACEKANKPKGCNVTLEQFLYVYNKIDHELLISRFYEMHKGK